jgi:hypothetical protein
MVYLVSYQKSQFECISEGLGMENVGIFFGHLEYFTAIWYILWQFGIYGYHWYIFSSFGVLCQEKSCNPAEDQRYDFVHEYILRKWQKCRPRLKIQQNMHEEITIGLCI